MAIDLRRMAGVFFVSFIEDRFWQILSNEYDWWVEWLGGVVGYWWILGENDTFDPIDDVADDEDAMNVDPIDDIADDEDAINVDPIDDVVDDDDAMNVDAVDDVADDDDAFWTFNGGADDDVALETLNEFDMAWRLETIAVNFRVI